jgi:hypothetical protein
MPKADNSHHNQQTQENAMNSNPNRGSRRTARPAFWRTWTRIRPQIGCS